MYKVFSKQQSYSTLERFNEGHFSIVTDGENLNSGDRNGLWKKMEEEKNFHDSNHSPLLKIYCILHGQIKGFNSSITTILFEVGSYRTVVG